MRKYFRTLPRYLLLSTFFLLIQSPVFSQLYASGLKDRQAILSSGIQSDRSLRAILFALEESFQVSFNYNDKVVRDLQLKNEFSWNKNEPLEKILERLATNVPLSFKKVDEKNYLILSPQKKASPKPDVPELNSTLPDKAEEQATEQKVQEEPKYFAAAHRITGTVRDANTPLPGVNIILKGTTIGTTSDADGKYAIDVGEGQGILVFSFIGYKTEEVAINNLTTIDVMLLPDIASLEEVVVVGYGTQKQSHITSAIETIKGEELEDLPVGNLGSALAGRILGLSVSGGNTRPGSQAELTIRNPMSLAKDGGNNNPLYVIDDVIQVGADGANSSILFNSLDPTEVESITILKDASAAIYGSRAANGVVIVKTKRGKIGKPTISYSGSYAINDEAYRTKMMSAYELAQYINITNGPYGANANAADKARFFSQDELDFYKTINHDWLDMTWQSAQTSRHTINVSGGADRATYFAGVSYYNQDGNLGKLDYDKWTFRAGADINVTAGLKVGLQVSGNQSSVNKIYSKIGGENVENDYRNLLRAPRYVPMYLNGLPVKLPGSFGNNLSSYHFGEMERLGNYTEDKDNMSTVNLYAEYSIPFVEGLKIKGSYARNTSAGRNEAVGTKYALYTFALQGENQHIYDQIAAATPTKGIASNDNRVRFTDTRAESYQANFSLSYNRDFGQHGVGAFFSVEKSESESFQDRAWKEDPSEFTNGQFRTAFGAIDGDTDAKEAGNLGYLGRINYHYGNKYLADFLFRSDASTKFAPANYWGKFYSLGLGWVISEENFFNRATVNFLKLRYSVGLLGKDDTRAWQWRQRYTFQNGKGAVFGDDGAQAGIGMKMEASPNPDATWSDDFKQNLGIDARFFDSRLSVTLEGFYNKATNMLLERTGNVPVTVGGTVASQNYGNANFFGYEIGLGWDGKVGSDFKYGVHTRFSWYDNKVKQGNFNDLDILRPWNSRPGQSSDYGKWGYDYLGMFRSQEEIDAYVEEYQIQSVMGVKKEELKPGMLYYRDVRGQLQPDGTFAPPDGIIDENDQIRLAKKASNHYGFGVTLRAGYKGLSLDAVISGSFGGWSEMDARNTLERNISNLFQNGPAYWGDVYDPDLNPGGRYPNPFHKAISLDPVSEFWRVSAFRMRMRNINLNYRIPNVVTEKLHISNARVIFSILNPINFYNPFGYKDSEGAWDTYPVLRTYSLGVNLTL